MCWWFDHSHMFLLAKSCCAGEVTSKFPRVDCVFVATTVDPYQHQEDQDLLQDRLPSKCPENINLWSLLESDDHLIEDWIVEAKWANSS